MTTKAQQLLVVDPDPKVRDAFLRLFSSNYLVTVFDNPDGALKWLAAHPDVAVIVSCANLTGHGGAVFLQASEHHAPHAARIMLTAEQSVEVLKAAVNSGHLFMLLTKPCSPKELISAVEAGCAHHDRLAQERLLLEKTLKGSVKLLIDMLSLFHADAFRKTSTMRTQAMKIAKRLNLKRTWELEMAILLSPLGEALLPKDILSRYRAAKTLTEQQKDVLERAPGQTRDLLKNIPQLDKVAHILYLSGRGFDGSGFPKNGPVGKDIPLPSRLVRILTDLWYASPENGVDAAAFEALSIKGRQYDPYLLEIARSCLLTDGDDKPRRQVTLCYIRALKPGDVLVDDILTDGGYELVLSRDHQLTETTIRRLEQYNHVSGIRQPIRVHREVEKAAAENIPA
ncbi:response regulator RpfG family c-di-GMP phosphodiesterase [Roseibium hamelinense]|uniref:Response regulator RpfG family c-di-GMP phosphodiesterase n=1 Tax=Roseibium hamelinense TaxID=150831 RepID=A0A562T1F8_9HYPH|nr:HD domain-containing phosphohydrolase [Roseibium hamelinense]MTI44526.1 response regulator [Roseibium hamelinense]TWI87495.1 response regulator RpfG family c-di-GMP phosphodiesterase [Roseibium hamelinense]